MDFSFSIDCALELDRSDPLVHFREKFEIPKFNEKDCHYFTGNSLGLQPKSVASFVNEELEAWKDLGVKGHSKGKNPWLYYHKFTKNALASIVGAKTEEVVSMNSLTVNLHLMLVSFYQPTNKRTKILIETGAFPSDQYALESHVQFRGLDPKETIIEISPRSGEHYLRTEDILDEIIEYGDSLALIMFGGVQYYTGQFFNLEKITRQGHEVGAMVGFDLAHAIGNVPMQLHDQQVDFAVWCGYKYLNSGPGGVAGIFVHEKHSNNSGEELPRFAGWWGHNEDERFKMIKGFKPMPGADGWQISNVNILSTAAHLASLQIFEEAGIRSLRDKSVKLTGFLEFLLDQIEKPFFEIITPRYPDDRGCQLSLLFRQKGEDFFKYLSEHGFVVDWRKPDVIRIAPVPLYNTFEEVFQLVNKLKELHNNL